MRAHESRPDRDTWIELCNKYTQTEIAELYNVKHNTPGSWAITYHYFPCRICRDCGERIPAGNKNLGYVAYCAICVEAKASGKPRVKQRPNRETWVTLCDTHTATEIARILGTNRKSLSNWARFYDYYALRKCKHCGERIITNGKNMGYNAICADCDFPPPSDADPVALRWAKRQLSSDGGKGLPITSWHYAQPFFIEDIVDDGPEESAESHRHSSSELASDSRTHDDDTGGTDRCAKSGTANGHHGDLRSPEGHKSTDIRSPAWWDRLWGQLS